MKAMVITRPGGPEVLEWTEVPEPEYGPEELLVRVRATAINRADLLQRMGGYAQPGPKPAWDIPGLEYAGEVAAVGSRVEGFQVGDRVMGLLAGGGYAEYIVTNQRLAMRVPEAMSWLEAGGTPEVFITAHDALLQCDLVAGERVLVHAVGSGVGVAAVQIAKVMGASLVAGTAGSDEKLAKARALGLDTAINYRTTDFAAETLAATGGLGADVILDVIGAAYWESNMRALAPRGRMIIAGLMGGTKAAADLGAILAKRARVMGTTLRARPLEEKAAATRAFERSILPHMANGRVRVVVDRVFPLAEAALAHTYVGSNANFGKVVLEV